ncbi:HEAT repeat domain-containing protein [Streptomyces xanthochromogenes]
MFSRDVPPTDAVAVALLALSRDPVPDVRWATASELAAHFTPAFREALLDLVNDSDCDVRAQAAIALGASNDRTSAVTDALVSVLDHGEQLVRLEIVYALARRDDPRTDDAWERVGELPPGFGEVGGGGQVDHRILGYWDYQRRHRSSGSHAD